LHGNHLRGKPGKVREVKMVMIKRGKMTNVRFALLQLTIVFPV